MTPSWQEFTIAVGPQSIGCLLGEPEQSAPRPAILLNFAMDRVMTLKEPPYDVPARAFIGAGHRALGFDLPCHGERAAAGEPKGIDGFVAEFLKGRDVFRDFVLAGRAVIDHVIEKGWAEPGRIYISGTSRGGYFALRLMAEDARIAGGVAFAPVTDWRALREFEPVKDQPEIAAMALINWASSLAGRSVWIAVGNRDARIGTECCLQFATALSRIEADRGLESSQFILRVVPGAGHRLPDAWWEVGAKHLLERADGGGSEGTVTG